MKGNNPNKKINGKENQIPKKAVIKSNDAAYDISPVLKSVIIMHTAIKNEDNEKRKKSAVGLK
jgi:hypothetical protein